MQKIIHRIAVCCLIALMSFKLFGGFSYNLYFWYNQKQLAKEHCINQNKPKLKCNGTCYLAKQLAKIENEYQKKQRQPAPFQVKPVEWIFVELISPKVAIAFEKESSTRGLFYYLETSSNHYSKIPTPPPNFV